MGSGGEFPAFDAAAATVANMHAAVFMGGGANDAVSPLFQIADSAAALPLGDVVEEIPGLQKGGWLGPITDLLESILKAIDGSFESIGIPYSYGYAIIALTLSVKLATFPLTKKQVESSIAMQGLQPRVKELQAMYANDPERLQMETARLYKEANFNPLAGCLPTFATLPVFIGLYRALSNAATEGELTAGFYWIPSLGGPTSIAARNEGSGFSWLWPFVDGHPPLGWHDTVAYLLLPVLLVVSQFVSQKIMTPDTGKEVDPAQQSSQAILKFLPLMIGFFSLNVPAGLTLYWFANNILSTGQTVLLRKITPKPDAMPALAAAMPMPGSSPAATQPVRVEYVPKSQRKSGSSGASSSSPSSNPSPPKVEPMAASLASEFADFDDGPARVVDVVEGRVVESESAMAAAAVASETGARKSKKGAGSRKRRSGSRK